MDYLSKGKAPTSLQNLQLGLKTLVSPQNPSNANHLRIIHSCYNNLSSLSSSSKLLPPPPFLTNSSSLMDDLIGTESGVYLGSNIINDDENKCHCNKNVNMKRNKKCKDEKKEYPPPIPLLAQTGKLQGRMPWVLTRHYIDGRLLINVEKVKHHEYFETHRENGRLLLNLVPLDNHELELVNHDHDHDDEIIVQVGDHQAGNDHYEDEVMSLGHNCYCDGSSKEEKEETSISSSESLRDSRVGALCNTNIHEQINCTNYLAKPCSPPLRHFTTVV